MRGTGNNQGGSPVGTDPGTQRPRAGAMGAGSESSCNNVKLPNLDRFAQC